MKDIQVILVNTRPAGEDLARLAAALASVEARTDLHRMMLGERVYALETMRNLVASERQLEPDGVGRHAAPNAGVPTSPFPERMAGRKCLRNPRGCWPWGFFRRTRC